MNWYLIAHTPTGVHVHPVNGDPTDGVDDQGEIDQALSGIEDQLRAMRALLGMPEDYLSRDGWNMAMAPGVPHRELLGQIPADANGLPACPHCYRQEVRPAPLATLFQSN